MGALSKEQRKRDAAEAVMARREAAAFLQGTFPAIEKAEKKLAYNKSNDVLFKLKNLKSELKELIDILSDPENDPLDK